MRLTADAPAAVPTVTSAPTDEPPLTDEADPAPPPAPDVFDVGLDPGRDDEPGLWMSWSLVDRARDRRTGSAASSTERTNAESSIKAWIAADYLRDAQED